MGIWVVLGSAELTAGVQRQLPPSFDIRVLGQNIY